VVWFLTGPVNTYALQGMLYRPLKVRLTHFTVRWVTLVFFTGIKHPAYLCLQLHIMLSVRMHGSIPSLSAVPSWLGSYWAHGQLCFRIGLWSKVVNQYSETNAMHFLFSLLGIKGFYMFRPLRAHPQEMLHKQQLVYCMRVMSVGCMRIEVPLQSWCSQLT
jgi:hypothetical protein